MINYYFIVCKSKVSRIKRILIFLALFRNSVYQSFYVERDKIKQLKDKKHYVLLPVF